MQAFDEHGRTSEPNRSTAPMSTAPMSSTGSFEIGSQVRFTYKSGHYVGEVVDVQPPRAVVKVLSVVAHPEQGDLHHPYDPDVPMFHERRALSYTEKALVPLRDMVPFHGEVVPYDVSLKGAVAQELARLDKLKRWSERASAQLEQLAREYSV